MTGVHKTRSELIAELREANARIAALETAREGTTAPTASPLDHDAANARLIAENATDMIWTMGMDLRFTFVSPSVLQLRGFTVDEAMTHSLHETIAPESVGEVTASLALQIQLARSGDDAAWDPVVFDALQPHKDGSKVFTRTHARLVRGADGLPSLIVGVTHDISEQRRVEDALRESEAVHRALVESLPDVVMRFDRHGRHLFVSENVNKVTAIEPSQFIGKTHRDLGFPEEECNFWEEAIRGVFDNGESWGTEFSFDGAVGPTVFDWRLVPEVDTHGAVRSILSVARDITAHRDLEQRYQMLFREMLDGFALHEIICDEHGEPSNYRFLDVNPAFEQLTGLVAGDIVGKTVLDALPGTERHWIETYGRVALTGKPVFFENYSLELDRYYEVTAFRPAPNQFACIFSDITDRKRVEEVRREEKARLENLLESNLLGLYFTNLEGEVFRANDAFLAIIGYTRADFDASGINWKDLTPPEFEHLDQRAAEEVFGGQSCTPYEKEYVRKDGSRVPVLLSVAVLSVAQLDQDRMEFACSVVELTEHKRAEARRRNLEEQLQQARKMEAIGRLAGGVAHDFNNVLCAISGNADLGLRDLSAGDPPREALEEISGAAKQATELTRQLLAFSRKQLIEPKVIDLSHLLQRMQPMLGRLIGEHIILQTVPQERLGRVRVDPSQVEQILLNLAINARDAMPDGGQLSIKTADVSLDSDDCRHHSQATPGEYVRLTVSDTGCGMSSETRNKIFEPFFTTKEEGQGTGLGLATVFGIVEQNGGLIEVDSEPGRGSSFKVNFPRVAGEAETLEPGNEPEPHGGRETVLVVEDEARVRRLAVRLLERLGYEVLATRTGGDALVMAEQYEGPIDLLLTDVVMPHMNGRELASRITELRPQIEVLYTSGYTQSVIAHHGVLDAGVQFIAKPFSLDTFASRVRGALDRRGDHGDD